MDLGPAKVQVDVLMKMNKAKEKEQGELMLVVWVAAKVRADLDGDGNNLSRAPHLLHKMEAKTLRKQDEGSKVMGLLCNKPFTSGNQEGAASVDSFAGSKASGN